MRDLVKELHLVNRVSFAGVKKNVFKTVKASDIGIISSKWEGFGLVALEYIASGLPALGSNNEGLREVIGTEKALFDIGDSEALAKLILKLNTDETYRESIRKVQMENLKNFDLDRAIQKHQQYYTKQL